ncbi:MAG: iron ABC transporter permease [Acidobacteria bacterium]|nr:iron ABC transporter permease [Acidobacteriota bacterium]MCH8990595.1 iron ABC transporter permease [Acidobacteriota bacterium]
MGGDRAMRLRTAAIIALPVAFLGYFFVYPLATILLTGLTSGDAGSAFAAVVTDPILRSVAWFTLWQAVASTVLTFAVGLPAAYVFARYSFPGRSVFRALTLVPFVLPTLAVATAMLALLGPTSPFGIDLRGTVWIILIAHVFYNLAIVIRGVGSFWEHIDPSIERAARVLGASRIRTFLEVTLPLLRPAILSAAALVFLFTFTSFGVVLVLGDLSHTTIEVEIWRQTTSFRRLDIAAALAIFQLVGVGLILFAYSRASQVRQLQLPYRPPGETLRRPRTAGERWFVGGTLAVLAVIVVIPIAVLVGKSLTTATGFGFENYTSLFTPTLGVTAPNAIGNTLRFAIPAVLIATLIGMLAAVSIAYERGRIGRVFDTALMLPLGASAVMIGFGFLVALDEPIDLRTSVILIPIAHSLVAIPFIVRSTVPAMRSIQHRLREAAAVLGASPAVVWREIDLPIISRAVAVGAAFAFAISVGEFGATAFIVRRTSTTIPVAIFRLLGRPGSFGRAMALSVMLMGLAAIAALAVEALRGATTGDI